MLIPKENDIMNTILHNFRMIKKRRNGMRTKFIFPLVLAAAILTLGGFIIRSFFQIGRPTSRYQIYQDATYGFSIEYPTTWEVRKDTHVFENGDAITFGISGSTQKKNTELTHGAQVAIAKPFSIKTSLSTWIQDYFPPQATRSKMTLTKIPMDSVEHCSSLGCMIYYFTLINNQVNAIAVFAQGPDRDKMVYENTTSYMLKSLQFNNDERSSAVSKIKALPEVIEYLKRVPKGLIAVNGESDNLFMVQVYEVKNGHTATFNWYNVSKTTGEVTKEF